MATETFINPGYFIIVSLKNDNMANYTFTTDQGWRVAEYRPFSTSYAVLHTPCIGDYQQGNYLTSNAREQESAASAYASAAGDDLLGQLTGRQLTFESYSADVLRQLLYERVAIRDRNRSSILGRITDVSGDMYGASLIRTPDGDKRKQGLEKTKFDLERELREIDERLWKDTAEIRERLITSAKKVDSTAMRSKLFSPIQSYDDNYERQGHAGFSD